MSTVVTRDDWAAQGIVLFYSYQQHFDGNLMIRQAK
jgi:hypothetical protein